MASIAINTTRVSSRAINKRLWLSLFATSTVIGGAYYYNSKKQHQNKPPSSSNKTLLASTAPLAAFLADKKDEHGFQEYQKIYNAIASKIQEYDGYDEGIGFGPVLVRLAWHQSGTYTKPEGAGCPYHLKGKDDSYGVGGSFGGTMIFSKEGKDPANNGLQNARWFLESVSKEFPWISRGDLYTLGGVVAVQELGGPKVGWRSGRENLDQKFQQTSKLPDASRDADYVRNYFGRLGLNDREAVSLIGAHALGSCHVNAPGLPDAEGEEEPSTGPASGYIGRWTASANFFTNEFFKLLLSEDWKLKEWDGPKQYINKDDLMMLPADIALIQDEKYLGYVKQYAENQDQFFKDFSKDFQKLLELGIDFGDKKSWYFKTLDEQA